ncbi:MAG: recombination protein RecR [Myxococcales bacterium FL481]|nr:MAG: recombination protein RecR [Myxococcales bacterium FL481]
MTAAGRDPLERLARLLARLPGIGEKSSLRLALAIARDDDDYAVALAEALTDVHANLRTCVSCGDWSVSERCAICSDPRRDAALICVVAHPQDRIAIERSGTFRGRYHILHGVLDPLAGVGPAQLGIDGLLSRLRDDSVKEVIVATSPNVEGDATALYLAKLMTPLGVRVTRIASGIAVGGELEYADLTTLSRAFEDRRALV